MPPASTQTQLRLAFTRWGRPERLRVDNGTPWGAARGDLPTDLGLWLAGLAVGLDYNPPATPQDNGVVERSQGTAKRWGEPHTCDTLEDLRQRLEMMDEIQRGEYPSVRGRSRQEAYPELAHSGRDFSPGWEESHWSLDAVAGYLTGYAGRRKVGVSGAISVYNRDLYIGVIHKKETVYLSYNPLSNEWVVADDEGRQLSRQPASEICRERIMTLTVTCKQPNKRTGDK
ncbi:DDE-type integrase/transposase/recombinase [Singulisphaera acidiphila]|uniref:DDE-type integrase/transposase/recombinase n=2 Tax=Singulisphaera acidiphila TaxID=466153 RepID=UPI0002470E7D|nr:DDE-type integrase/transposase/recombinase [Singulisphaera acidiphila]